MFLNGGAIETPELLRSIDTISATYDGFYFGRYDIRTPSVDEFQAGRNFKIVELNGVTSEVTHIYQPGSSLRNAYRDLRRQWRIAGDSKSTGNTPIRWSHTKTPNRTKSIGGVTTMRPTAGKRPRRSEETRQ